MLINVARGDVMEIPGQLVLFPAIEQAEPSSASADRCQCCGAGTMPGAETCRFCRLEDCGGECGLIYLTR